MNDNRSITCVKTDNKEIKHVAYGKITTFSLFCSEKNTWFLMEFKAIIQSEDSHEGRNCESMLPKAEPQEIIEALES